MRIDDRDDVEPFLAQIGNHLRRIGKSLAVPREGFVIVLVVNVEPDRVGGSLAAAKVVGDESHFAFRVIAVAALVISEGPERREWHAPGERRVALDHLLWIGTIDEVVVERAPLGAERKYALRLMPDVEIASECVVEKDAECDSMAKDDVERNGDVNWIGAGVVAEGVAVPHGEAVTAELPAAFVEWD